ncbi:hypothetical protein Amn_pb01040 (plasmid) [Aminobacter sp. Y103A]|jgi:hypothetical protein|uniref:hypothetical protein n=1 Tax=Aminobacter sp. Y103A TaxID=1870862 RepID=UPI002574467D|nr:hypothetical protein [Aminobacter sp. SS-2016]BBD41113.1 hypothetical protein Amn_pb01040 [Aminobacter sp. SS-2016]
MFTQNNEQMSLWQRWDQYTPSKKIWFWSVISASILTMVLGFTAGGWVTGGSAGLMANVAARNARTELAASECVNRFISDNNAEQQLTALKALSAWQRDDFVREGGWVLFGSGEVVGADVRCADTLAAMDGIPEQEATAVLPAG